MEELASALTTQLTKDRERAQLQLQQLKEAEKQLEAGRPKGRVAPGEEKQRTLEALEKRIFAMSDGLDDVIELNVGGSHMSTTRGVLCCAPDSMLAGMFSGNFDSGHKRDKALGRLRFAWFLARSRWAEARRRQENRIFLDVDPPLFEKVLRHLRLRRIASPEQPAPLPHVPEDGAKGRKKPVLGPRR